MKHLRTGVIGLGRMGQHHCRVYASQRESRLTGLFDIDSQITRELSLRYGVPAYQNLDDLLDQVDAVSIATPTPTHYDLVMRCLEHDVHVLVEKPVTETLEQAEELARAVEKSSLVVQVGHIERFNPTYLELKKVIEDLNVIAMDFRRLSPYQMSTTDVDVVLDLMVHDLDLSNDLMRREPDSISAYGLTPFSIGFDHVVALLCYANGPMVTLTASRVTENKIRTVVVTAEKAFIEADFMNKHISVYRCSLGKYTDQKLNGVKYHQESIIERILVPTVEPLASEINHFLQCITQNCMPCVSIFDGLKALQLALQIRDSVDEQNQRLAAQPNWISIREGVK